MQNDIVKRPIIAPGRTINDVQPAPAMAMQASPALPSMTPQQQVVEQPVQQQLEQEQAAQNQPVPAQEQEQEHEQEQAHMEAQLHTEEHHQQHPQTHTPAGAIFLATIVFLILAAAAVYSQLQASGSTL